MPITAYKPSFTPTSIPGLALWLDASDTSTISLSGSSVTAWNDKSGNGISMTTSNGNPTYTSNAINGLPVMNLTNSSCFISSSSPILTSNLSLAMVVVVQSGIGTWGSFFTHGGRDTDFALEQNGLKSNIIHFQTANDNSSAEFTYTTGVPALYLGTMTSGTSRFFEAITGGTTATTTATNGYTMAGGTAQLIRVGRSDANESCNSYIAEVIYFTSVLTDTQRQQIEGYLTWKWGLQASLVSGHPYRTAAPNTIPSIAFTPKSITGCTLWVDAADPAGTGVMPANGASLTTWVDKSGTGTNLTGSGSPTLGTYNGLRIVNFSSSYFQNTSYTQSGPLTIIFIGKMNAGTDWQAFSDNVSGLRPYVGLQVETPNKRTAFRYGGAATTNVEIWTLTYSSSDNIVFNVNGADVRGNIAGYGGIGFTNGVRLGYAGNNSAYLNGWIGEYFIYNTELGSTQYKQIEGYLAWKWGLQASLPVGHPYLAAAPTAGVAVKNTISALPYYTQFNPNSIAGCCLWLDGADQTNFTFSSGTNINNWNDKSGNSNTFATTQGTVTYSNKAAYFNGSSIMTNTSQTGFAYGSSVSMIRFVVFNASSVSPAGAIFSYGNNTVGAVIYVDTDSNVYGTSYSGVFSIKNPISMNTNYLVSDFYSNNGTANNYTHYGWLNGIPYSTNATTSASLSINSYSTAYVGAAIGNISPFNGYIYEIIFYNKALTTTQRQSVESYLAAKWGLTSQLPNFTSPLQIPGCSLWLDASDSTQITFSSSTNVNAWNDKSGFANKCINQSVGTTITYPGTQINGLNTVNFTAGCIRGSLTGASVVNTTDVTIFIITSETAPNNNLRIFSLTTAANYQDDQANQMLVYASGNYQVTFYRAGAMPAAYTTTQNVPFLYTVTQTSGTGSQWFNGGSNVTASITTSAFSVTNYNIGTQYLANQNYTGLMCEIIMYNTLLTTTQRQQVEGYLAAKWGLKSSLPITHPYYVASPIHSHYTIPAGRNPIVAAIVPTIPRGIGYVYTFYTTTRIFTYTGADQSFVVPTSISPATVTVYMWGAGGGGGWTGTGSLYGGAGAYLQGILTVTPGATLTMIVGCGGVYRPNIGGNTTSSYGGGGTAGAASGSGGGRSAIRVSGASDDLVTVGSGGGASYINTDNCYGGNGDSVTGTGGDSGISGSYYGGKGGTQSAGGIVGSGNSGSGGTAGSKYTGGNANVPAQSGGGGGSGYYGGGGGGYYSPGSGGGGGSSLTSNLTNIVAINSPDRSTAPNTTSISYQTGVASGGGTGLGGGNGLIVVMYTSITPPPVSSGGTVTVNGLYRVHTFTTVGTTTFTLSGPASITAQLLVVAGGGGSGNPVGTSGGGGAGGLIFLSTVTLTSAGSPYTVTVGAGGSYNVSPGTGGAGSNSVFGTYTALGGGYGGHVQAGGAGGSGGGSTDGLAPGAALQPTSASGGFGNPSGTSAASPVYGAGGGGGAGSIGGNGTTSGGGNGGVGMQITIGGSTAFYAGGGGGGANGGGFGLGGTGGGGNGSSSGSGVNATANTGGGGGGSTGNTGNSLGGSGIVIIAFPN